MLVTRSPKLGIVRQRHTTSRVFTRTSPTVEAVSDALDQGIMQSKIRAFEIDVKKSGLDERIQQQQDQIYQDQMFKMLDGDKVVGIYFLFTSLDIRELGFSDRKLLACAEYRGYHKEYITLEKVADEYAVTQRLLQWPLPRLVREGYAVTETKATVHSGLFAEKMIRFHIPVAQHPIYRQISIGSQVLCCRSSPLSDDLVHKFMVYRVTPSYVDVLCNEQQVPHDVRSGKWRLDVSFNSSIYDLFANKLSDMTSPLWNGDGLLREFLLATHKLIIKATLEYGMLERDGMHAASLLKSQQNLATSIQDLATVADYPEMLSQLEQSTASRLTELDKEIGGVGTNRTQMLLGELKGGEDGEDPFAVPEDVQEDSTLPEEELEDFEDGFMPEEIEEMEDAMKQEQKRSSIEELYGDRFQIPDDPEINLKLDQLIDDLRTRKFTRFTNADELPPGLSITAANERYLENLEIELSLLKESAGMNSSQLRAIRNALTRKFSLIQGPPGSGKTFTIAHLIKLYHDLNPEEDILVCAPSNIAIDQIVSYLVKIDEDPLRIGHHAKVIDGVLDQTLEAKVYTDPEALEYEVIREKKKALVRDIQFSQRSGYKVSIKHIKKVKELSETEQTVKRKIVDRIFDKYRVICATCSGSARFSSKKYGLILVDEATQSIEAETLVPLAQASGNSQIVLIGDQRQLPPTVCNPLSQELGFTSLFNRLVSSGWRTNMLNIQYRMHPVISAWPSRTYYFNRLQNGAATAKQELPQGWDWPLAGPISFVPVFSEEQTFGVYQTSYMNIEEVKAVYNAIEKIMDAGDIKEDEVGIISPYLGQVQMLRRSILPKWPQIEIATVDGYQGREKDVIIISTVRSNPDGQLGFVHDQRRLNVAITRAKRGLIVIGNSTCLSNSHDWKSFISYVERCRGMKSPPEDLGDHEKYNLEGIDSEITRLYDQEEEFSENSMKELKEDAAREEEEEEEFSKRLESEGISVLVDNVKRSEELQKEEMRRDEKLENPNIEEEIQKFVDQMAVEEQLEHEFQHSGKDELE